MKIVDSKKCLKSLLCKRSEAQNHRSLKDYIALQLATTPMTHGMLYGCPVPVLVDAWQYGLAIFTIKISESGRELEILEVSGGHYTSAARTLMAHQLEIVSGLSDYCHLWLTESAKLKLLEEPMNRLEAFQQALLVNGANILTCKSDGREAETGVVIIKREIATAAINLAGIRTTRERTNVFIAMNEAILEKFARAIKLANFRALNTATN